MTIQIPCPGLMLQGIKNTGYKDGTQSENSCVIDPSSGQSWITY